MHRTLRALPWGLLPIIVALPAPTLADDMIVLLDKTKIVGKVQHYYDGMLTISLPSGSRMRLPRNKVLRINFKLPKPRAELSTPRKAFTRLRKAALKGDVETYIDAHSAYYQMFLTHQVAQVSPAKFRAQLKKEWESVQLQVVGEDIKGDQAVLKIRRRSGLKTEEGEFRFVKENKEWKMILPL